MPNLVSQIIRTEDNQITLIGQISKRSKASNRNNSADREKISSHKIGTAGFHIINDEKIFFDS